MVAMTVDVLLLFDIPDFGKEDGGLITGVGWSSRARAGWSFIAEPVKEDARLCLSGPRRREPGADEKVQLDRAPKRTACRRGRDGRAGGRKRNGRMVAGRLRQ